MHSATLQHRINSLAISIIESQQAYLAQLGYQAHIHFELEGCFAGEQAHVVDLATINQWLARRCIAGKLVSEYWQNQWEYISHFNGQTPLQEAHNLFFAMNNLANIVKRYVEHYQSPTAKLLDIGCGVGRCSFELAAVFDWVDAVDFSARYIQYGVRLHSKGLLFLVSSYHVRDSNIEPSQRLGEHKINGENVTGFTAVEQRLDKAFRLLAQQELVQVVKENKRHFKVVKMHITLWQKK